MGGGLETDLVILPPYQSGGSVFLALFGLFCDAEDLTSSSKVLSLSCSHLCVRVLHSDHKKYRREEKEADHGAQ